MTNTESLTDFKYISPSKYICVVITQYLGLKSKTGTFGALVWFSGTSDKSLRKLVSKASASFSSLKLKS